MRLATLPVRWRALLLSLVLAFVGSTAAAAPASAYTVTGPRLSRISVVVALGDSVAYGTRCGCLPYPQQSAALVRATTGRSVRAYDDAAPGMRTGGVLAALRTNATVISHVRAADVVEVEIGANDVGYTSACGTSTSCYAARLEASEVNVAAIVSRIRALTAGRQVAIVLLGYWNVWLDGRYAAARGAAYVAASRWLTLHQNASFLALARARGAIYVDAWRVFRGTTDADDTWLLAWDGDHPNATGQRRLAVAIAHALRVLLPA